MDGQLQAQLPNQIQNQIQTSMSAQMQGHLSAQISSQLPNQLTAQLPPSRPMETVNQEESTPGYEPWKGDNLILFPTNPREKFLLSNKAGFVVFHSRVYLRGCLQLMQLLPKYFGYKQCLLAFKYLKRGLSLLIFVWYNLKL